MQNQDIRRAFQLMENYSPRQIELILTPVEQLSRYPSEKELGATVEQSNRY